MDKFKFKITVIGDGFVGKTSLIKKFTQGSFRNITKKLKVTYVN